MEKAGQECLPSTGGKKSSSNAKITGWNDYVKPYTEESKFWFQLWMSAGRPAEGDVYLNMKLSKKQFKFAVRRLKRCQAPKREAIGKSSSK